MLGREGFNLRVQAAFMARSLVLVDDTLVRHAVYYRYRTIISRFSRCRVATADSGIDFFDHCSHQRAQTGVVRSALFSSWRARFLACGEFATGCYLDKEQKIRRRDYSHCPPLVNRSLAGLVAAS